jgi:hypothetical protein
MTKAEMEKNLRNFFGGIFLPKTVDDMVKMSIDYIYAEGGKEEERYAEIIEGYTPTNYFLQKK